MWQSNVDRWRLGSWVVCLWSESLWKPGLFTLYVMRSPPICEQKTKPVRRLTSVHRHDIFQHGFCFHAVVKICKFQIFLFSLVWKGSSSWALSSKVLEVVLFVFCLYKSKVFNLNHHEIEDAVPFKIMDGWRRDFSLCSDLGPSTSRTCLNFFKFKNSLACTSQMTQKQWDLMYLKLELIRFSMRLYKLILTLSMYQRTIFSKVLIVKICANSSFW